MEQTRLLGKAVLDELNAKTAELKNEIINAKGQIVKTIQRATGQIIEVVLDAENNIINVTEIQSAITRNVVREQGVITRNETRRNFKETNDHISEQGAVTRNVVRGAAHETQQIEDACQKISDRLSSIKADTAFTAKVDELREKVVRSDMTLEEKLELLDEIAKVTYTKNEIDSLTNRIEKQVQEAVPAYETPYQGQTLPPKAWDREEVPVYEDPFARVHDSGSISSAEETKPHKNGGQKADEAKPNKGKQTQDTKPIPKSDKGKFDDFVDNLPQNERKKLFEIKEKDEALFREIVDAVESGDKERIEDLRNSYLK